MLKESDNKKVKGFEFDVQIHDIQRLYELLTKLLILNNIFYWLLTILNLIIKIYVPQIFWYAMSNNCLWGKKWQYHNSHLGCECIQVKFVCLCLSVFWYTESHVMCFFTKFVNLTQKLSSVTDIYLSYSYWYELMISNIVTKNHECIILWSSL